MYKPSDLVPRKWLEKAMENGWHPRHVINHEVDGAWSMTFMPQGVFFKADGMTSGHMSSYEAIVLDVTFWQALSKAMGWDALDLSTHVEKQWQAQAQKLYSMIVREEDIKAFWFVLDK